MIKLGTIFQTGFYTSGLSYIMFLLADFIRPGFVSYVFSVHWFLLAIIIFAVLWVLIEPERSGMRLTTHFSFTFVGFIMFVFFWKAGTIFGDLRVFLALIAFTSPWAISGLLKNNDETYD